VSRPDHSPPPEPPARARLWANISSTKFKRMDSDVKLLKIEILEASYKTTAGKTPITSFIEVMDVASHQAHKTDVIPNSHNPKFRSEFIFRTQPSSANDLLVMVVKKVNEQGAEVEYGSSALPFDSRHIGSEVSNPIFDTNFSMMGVVRVRTKFLSPSPRRLRVDMLGLQDLPDDTRGAVSCCLLNADRKSNLSAPSDVVAGCVMFVDQSLELTVPPGKEDVSMQVELQPQPGADPVILGKSELQAPAASPTTSGAEQQLTIYPSLGSNLPHNFVLFVKAYWLD